MVTAQDKATKLTARPIVITTLRLSGKADTLIWLWWHVKTVESLLLPIEIEERAFIVSASL
jgi:hypothetical protein